MRDVDRCRDRSLENLDIAHGVKKVLDRLSESGLNCILGVFSDSPEVCVAVGRVVVAEEVLHPRLSLRRAALEQRQQPLESVKAAVWIFCIRCTSRVKCAGNRIAGEANLLSDLVVRELPDEPLAQDKGV